MVRDERVAPRRVGPPDTALERGEERRQPLAHVPRECQRRGRKHSARCLGLDVEVDDLLTGRPGEGGRAALPQPGGHAAPGEQHDVRLPQGAQHRLTGDQPAVAEERRIVRPHGAQAHLRRSHGGAEPAGDVLELGGRVREDDAAARDQQGALGVAQERSRALDVLGREGRARDGIRRGVELRDVEVGRRGEDVGWKLDVHRPRPAGERLRGRPPHERRNLLGGLRDGAPLRRRTHQAGDVGGHRQPARGLAQVGRRAGGEHEHGEPIGPCRAEAADEVVRSRPHLAVAGSESPGRVEGRRRHPGRRRLVPCPEMPDARLGGDCAQERPELAGRHAEQVLDAHRDEGARQGASAVQLDGRARGRSPPAHDPFAPGRQCGSASPGTGVRKDGIVVPIRLPR